MDVPLQPSGNVTLMLHRNHQGTFRKGYTETTRNVLLRFSYNLLGTFPQGYQKTIRERYWGTFMNVWETFHFNVMGTLHGNVFYGFGGTFWERSGNVKLLAGYQSDALSCLAGHSVWIIPSDPYTVCAIMSLWPKQIDSHFGNKNYELYFVIKIHHILI